MSDNVHTTTLQIEIDSELKHQFKILCMKRKISMKDALTQYIESEVTTAQPGDSNAQKPTQ